jgi:photosystem II stability/assembly factor-like uncharacterized protein
MKSKFYLLQTGLLALFLFMAGNSALNAQFTLQPVNVTECEYSGTTNKIIPFSVEGTKILSAQWQAYNGLKWVDLLNGDYISGAATKTVSFTFNKLNPLSYSLNGFKVRCKVTTILLGTSYSNEAILTVQQRVSISGHPAPATRIVGESPTGVTFSVTSVGTGRTFQWKKDGISISGATSSSYTISSVALSHAGTYTCTVTGTCNTLTSYGALLTVYNPLVITKQPSGVATCAGTNASYSVTASGPPNITYQWYYKTGKLDPVLITGATSSTYTKTSVTSTDGLRDYFCVVSGDGGQTVTSNLAGLTVYTYPTVTTHPVSQTKNKGESVSFSIVAGGSSVGRVYQWQVNKGSGYTNISGASAASLTLSDILVSDAGSYRCRVTNTCSVVYSNAAVLTVNEPQYPNGWFKQTSGTSQNLYAVSPISDTKAWAVSTGESDKLLKTIDGGTTWTSVATGYSGNWRSIKFLSETNGLLGGYNGISRTINSGGTWTYTNLHTQFGLVGSDYFYVENFHFVNASVGFGVGWFGLVIKTTDGGATWSKVNYKGSPIVGADAHLYAVAFADANTGWVGGASGKLYKTTNGGTDWTEQTSNTAQTILEIAFINTTTGYFITAENQGIYGTTNGGSTWTKINSSKMPTVTYLQSITFVNATFGFAAGRRYDSSLGANRACIIKTYDGGLTWVEQKTTSSLSTLARIRMVDNNHGWVVGSGGDIHRTGVGGCHTPFVSLFEDKDFCAGQSYKLVADTFQSNVNGVRYLWNTSSTAGNITVGTSGMYKVTVSNECNVSASDSINLTFNDLPLANAGEDVSICAGGSTQLEAAGGLLYSWNNGSYLSDVNISNPIATPPLGQTTFTVTVTDDKGCVNTDQVKVTVNAIPGSDFTAPAFVCGTDNAAFSYSGSTSGKTFIWDFDEGSNQSGTGGAVNVNWNEIGVKQVSLSVIANNCESVKTEKIIEVRPRPSSSFTIPETLCGSSPAVLFYAGDAPIDAFYNWSLDGGTITDGNGQGPLMVSWASGGLKTVGLTVTQNECVSSQSIHNTNVSYPYAGSSICMVTIDLETGKNMVLWEKTHGVGIAYYKVYREGFITGQYNLIGEVPFSEFSLFVDTEVNPENGQELYKISAVDTCGNESALSPYHKTMFLQFVSSDGGVNLSWEPYEVEGGTMNFQSYVIYRGIDHGP